MTEISLKEYLLDHSQTQAAELMNVGQSAVSQMVASDRDIRLVFADDGSLMHSYERKPVGRRGADFQQVA